MKKKVDMYTEMVALVIGEYNDYLINEQGMDVENLINFEWEGATIHDPCSDAHAGNQIDPVKYYGKDFLNSDFVNSELVKRLVKEIKKGFFDEVVDGMKKMLKKLQFFD